MSGQTVFRFGDRVEVRYRVSLPEAGDTVESCGELWVITAIDVLDEDHATWTFALYGEPGDVEAHGPSRAQ